MKYLLIIIILSSSFNSYSQNENSRFYKNFLKKDSLYPKHFFSVKIGANDILILSNKYTTSNTNPFLNGAGPPAALYHFKYYSIFSFESAISHKFYFFNERVVFEPGIGFIERRWGYKRTDGSFTISPLFTNTQKLEFVENDFGIPILVGITNHETTISVGNFFTMINSAYSFYVPSNHLNNIYDRKYGFINPLKINPVLNINQNIIDNKRLGIDVYVSIEFLLDVDETFVHFGTEVNF